MAITKSQCKRIREKEGTVGGVTYYITKKGDVKEYPVCFRIINNKEKNPDGLLRCANPAGHNTDHPGTGACSVHGGVLANVDNVIKFIKNGRSAYVTRASLSGKIERYLNEDAEQLFDLSKELAALRAIFEEVIEKMAEPTDPLKYGDDVFRIVNLVGTIGTLVEKISRINSRNTLTSAQVLYLRATVADILVKYIRDPNDREQAVKELTSRVTGNELPDYNLVKRESWEEVEDG
jgi:hypothetical protein